VARTRKALTRSRCMSSTAVSISVSEASLRMSTMSASPPGRKTRYISAKAPTGSLKFLNAARQTTKSKLSAGELAEATGLTTGAITGVIDRLERAGFARRDRHGSDRRKVLVRALPAVDRRIGPLFQPMERGAMSVLSQFSDKELAFLLDAFSRLGEAA